MDIKEIVNQEAVKLFKEHRHLIIEHPTSSGKGKRVAMCIAECKSLKKWLILVPEIAQIENYKQDLIKHGYEWLLKDKIEDIICYASLKNYENVEFNLHLNECHRMSEFRTDVVQTICFDKVISDSATINEEVAERLWQIEPYHLYKITFEEAIQLKLIPQPIIYLLSIKLDNVNKVFKAKYGKKEVELTALEFYNKLSKDLIYWKDQWDKAHLAWQKNKMLQIAMQRKRFLASQKTEKAKEIIEKLYSQNKRFICFTGSVEQAKQLGGNKTISATIGKKENLQVIKDFNNFKTNSIYSCSMAIEGMNFTSMDCGIIVQLDREQRLPIQKIGRMMRSENPEVYIIYVKDSQDEKYLNEFLENSNIKKEFIKHLEMSK